MEKNVSDNIRVILDVVRKVTKAIKVFPFLYAILLLFVMPIIAYSELAVTEYVSALIYVSLLIVLFLIYLSYSVKLCIWHRLQCCLPLLPQISVFVDENIYEFGNEAMLIDFITLAIIFLLSLINAYFVFIKPTQKRPTIVYQSSRPIVNIQSSTP